MVSVYEAVHDHGHLVQRPLPQQHRDLPPRLQPLWKADLLRLGLSHLDEIVGKHYQGPIAVPANNGIPTASGQQSASPA